MLCLRKRYGVRDFSELRCVNVSSKILIETFVCMRKSRIFHKCVFIEAYVISKQSDAIKISYVNAVDFYGVFSIINFI
mgnify:CR=1 FL=1